MLLTDKIIIVTGGNGLIGKSIVQYLKNKEAIVINADLHQVENFEIGEYYCDITNQESVLRLINNIIQKYNRIDGIVNNAYPRTSDWGVKFEDIPYESWATNVDMQLNSCFFICQQVALQMEKQKNGSIVNISSIYGIVGNDFTVYDNTGGMTSPAAYSAIKAGVINFSRYLASYYGSSNIRVNCVSPGGIFNSQNVNFVSQFEAKVPLRRMGNPDEIAPAICFLLSDEASYITGHNLVVDGGWTAI